MHQPRHRSLIHAVVFGGVLGLAASAAAQTAPDNTKVNKRDRAEGALTADQQKENAADRELAKKIRAALTDDDTLSTYAHNVKIIVAGRASHAEGPGALGSREDLGRSQGDRDRRQGQSHQQIIGRARGRAEEHPRAKPKTR